MAEGERLIPASQHQRIIIVGAGPTGLLLAHHLLLRPERFQVEIYEGRGDPRDMGQEEKITRYGIGLSMRAQNAMEPIEGLWQKVKEYAVPVTHIVSHQRGGKQRQSNWYNNVILIDRVALANVLLQELDARHAGRFRIYFNHKCTSVDLSRKTVTFSTGQTVHYDLLVGADGVRSKVREALDSGAPGFESRVDDTYSGWKTMPLDGESYTGQKNAMNTIRYTSKIHKAPTGLPESANLSVLPQQDGSACMLMYVRDWSMPRREILDITPEQLQTWFAQHFPVVKPSLQQAEAFLSEPLKPTLEVRCNRYHDVDGSVVVVGDSAHAMMSTLSLGGNTGMQDVAALVRLLDEYEDDFKQVLPLYSSQRVEEGHAAAKMSFAAFPLKTWLLYAFFLYQALTMLLHKYLPTSISPRPLFNALAGSVEPCSNIWQRHKWLLNLCDRVNTAYINDALARLKRAR